MAQSSYAPVDSLALAVTTAVVGVVALAAGIAGFFRKEAGWMQRTMFLASAGMLLFPDTWLNIGGAVLFAITVALNAIAKDTPGASVDQVSAEKAQA